MNNRTGVNEITLGRPLTTVDDILRLQLLSNLGSKKDQHGTLVIQARQGDADAFSALASELWVELVSLARATLANSLNAEDVVQDSLLVAWTRIKSLKDPTAFRPWLCRIVVRRCWKLAKRPNPVFVEPDDRGRIASTHSTIDVERALRRLSARQRTVTYLSWIEGMTDSEVASFLGMARATVRVHRSRARSNLQTYLQGQRKEQPHEE